MFRNKGTGASVQGYKANGKACLAKFFSEAVLVDTTVIVVLKKWLRNEREKSHDAQIGRERTEIENKDSRNGDESEGKGK